MKRHQPDGDCPSEDSDDWEVLSTIFCMPWFQRRWVIQEVVLSRCTEVQLGPYQISWRWLGLSAAILRTRYNPMIRRMEFPNVYSAYLMFQLCQNEILAPKQMKFIQILRLTSGFEVSNVHDTIFALLGMSFTDHSPNGVHFIEPDYTVDEQTIFRDITEKLLQQDPFPLSFLCDAPGIEYFCHDGKVLTRNEERSWMPRWGPRIHSLLIPWTLGDSFEPARGLPFMRYQSHDPACLSVQGVHISTVIWTSAHLHTYGDESNAGTEFHWGGGLTDLEDVIESGAIKPLSRPKVALLSRTICAGRDAYGSREPRKEALLPGLAIMMLEMRKRAIFDAAEVRRLEEMVI